MTKNILSSPPSSKVMRATGLTLALLILISSPLSPVNSEERDNAKEAVVNLKAYAAYKMGQYDKAKQIWEGLAKKGNTTALLNLANLFQQGQGVTKDDREAHVLLEKAATLGDARAQYELGMSYEKGHVVERDIDKAAEWLKKSADQGFSDGQFAYGVMLATARGQGIDQASRQDKQAAIDLLAKAKAGGHLEAGNYLDTLRASLD